LIKPEHNERNVHPLTGKSVYLFCLLYWNLHSGWHETVLNIDNLLIVVQ